MTQGAIALPASPRARSGAWVDAWRRLDPRYAIAVILFAYLVLGFTVLGFNRSPTQAFVTSASACALEVALTRIFKRTWIWPLSALITSFSLSILLNYAHDYWLLFVPVFFAIGSKYVFTLDGRHVLNPAQAGVTLSLFSSEELITAAPAYQWNGIASMSVFIVMLGLIFLVPQVRRGPLVIAFLATFTVTTALRAVIMRWHLPFETLFFGTLSSPAFFLFTFFMITDPATSPADPRAQVKTGVLLALVDLALHLQQSYFTFFYAAFLLGAARLLLGHLARARAAGDPLAYVRSRAIDSGYYRRPLFLGGLAAAGVLGYGGLVRPELEVSRVSFRFEAVPPAQSGVAPELGDALTRVDPRIHHVAKWLLSVGDAVATGDFDGDGRQDLFFTFTLKKDGQRNALYRNLGDFRFERVALPALAARDEIERYGLPGGALFADYDNDGDLDLWVAYASGSSVLLQNRLAETGRAELVDVTAELGLDAYGNSLAANWLDANGDGRLDLLVANVLPEALPGYARPKRLDLFHLPPEEHPGDERPYDFMHSSWHQADNGGLNVLYLQGADGRFERQSKEASGLTETRWSLVVGTADLDQDGDTDVYVANDFGPDDLYFNEGGRFVDVEGASFGSIGRDTYKGMNASIADLDHNGWLDVYVSNVHHALQAEGSLAWMFGPGRDGRPHIEDRASQLGLLNERRFGWGASLSDFDNDGWTDVAQANGMVDDTPDKRFDECRDYWYVNEKVARSPPSIHTKANRWGDIRGFCIFGKELNRLYLNRGAGRGRRFVDVAESVGLTERTNSRGMAAVDLDDDGRRDLIITHQFAPPSILRNVAAPDAPPAHFIGIELVGDGRRCNRMGLGSTVRVGAQLQEAQAGTGFSAQDDRRLHFGLGEHAGPVDVEVLWCGRERVRYAGLAPDRYHRLSQ